MRNVWKIIKDDFRLLFSNVISIVVVIGLIAIPGMYVWFNLIGVWNPYNNVDKLEVAIVNEDKGYQSEILPMDLKLGNTLVSALRENKGLKWAFTNQDEAMEKLMDSTYYAVIIIPEDFSNQLLSIISGEVDKADIIYYSNEKSNPIAPKITGKGASAIQQKINTAFSNTVYSVLLRTASNSLSADNINDATVVGKALTAVLRDATAEIDNIKTEMDMLNGQITSLKKSIDNVVNDIPSGMSQDAQDMQAMLDKIKQELQTSIANLQYVRGLVEGLPNATKWIDDMISLLWSVTDTINNTSSILNQAQDAGDSLIITLNSVSDLLSDCQTQVTNMQDTLSIISGDLNNARTRINALSDTSSINDIKSIIGEDPTKLANLITSPVMMDRHAVFPMMSNAASMSGFYISICIWVGSLILAALLKAELSRKREEELKKRDVKGWQIYLGRYAVFGVIAMCQVTFIGLGCLFFLQIDCVHPFMYMLTLWLVAICYSLFIYTMLASFGSVGKALCVILLVLQIAASGGTFPIQLLAEPFQIISPYLPTTYSLRAINMCIAGYVGSDLLLCMLDLCLTMIPFSLAIGLVLRGPISKVTDLFKEKVKEANILAI